MSGPENDFNQLFTEQSAHFVGDASHCRKGVPMTEKILDLCWGEIQFLKQNIEGDNEFANAVLLFNAIKNLRRQEKDGTEQYTPLFVDTVTDDQGRGLDRIDPTSEEYVKERLRQGAFFTDDDAVGWLYDGEDNTETFDDAPIVQTPIVPIVQTPAEEPANKSTPVDKPTTTNVSTPKVLTTPAADKPTPVDKPTTPAMQTRVLEYGPGSGRKALNSEHGPKAAKKSVPKKSLVIPPNAVEEILGKTLSDAWRSAYETMVHNRGWTFGHQFDSQEFMTLLLEKLAPTLPNLQGETQLHSVTKIETMDIWESKTPEPRWFFIINNEEINRIRDAWQNPSGKPNLIPPLNIRTVWNHMNKSSQTFDRETSEGKVTTSKKIVTKVPDKNKNLIFLFPPEATDPKNPDSELTKSSEFEIEVTVTPPHNEEENNDEAETDDEETVETQKKLMRYHLTGVICHIGKTISSGHYIAYVRRKNNKDNAEYEWFKCDDKTITKVRGDIVKKLSQYFKKPHKHLYMMVYTRDIGNLPTTRPSPLKNTGNTCFANAAVQVLTTLPSVSNIVERASPKTKTKRKSRKKGNGLRMTNEEFYSSPYFVVVGKR